MESLERTNTRRRAVTVTDGATDRSVAVARRLKLLAHPERLRILDVLRRGAECVCHLEATLDRPQPYISQQLAVLRTSGVIADEKDGQNVYYRIADAEVLDWLEVLMGPVGTSADGSSRSRSSECPCPKCTVEPRMERAVGHVLAPDREGL